MRGEAERGWNPDERSWGESEPGRRSWGGGGEEEGGGEGSNNKSSGEENLRQTRLEDKWLA